VVRGIENDENYQPNAEDAQEENQNPLAKAHQQSQNTLSRLASDELAMAAPCLVVDQFLSPESYTGPF
jgi:hypothetical protein